MWITTKILFSLYAFFNLWLTIRWGNFHELLDPWTYFVHFFSLALIFFYSEFFNKLLKIKFLRISVSIFLIAFYIIMGKYRYRVSTSFDYAILHDNFYEIFNGAAFGVVKNTLKPKDFIQGFLMIPLFLFLQFKYQVFTKNIRASWRQAFVYLTSFFILIGAGPLPYGEISYIFSSAWDFHFGGYPRSKNFEEITKKKEFWTETINSSMPESRPNIFLINVESFNGLYVDKKTDQGVEITPNFNKLKNEGLYIDDFYGNSIQSIKGQYAVLCSMVPLIRGKSSYNIKTPERLNCFPKVLKELGYKSFYHKCFSNVHFDNTHDFMRSIGFDEVTSTDTSHLSKEERQRYIWGWGVQDNISYPQYLDHFERIAKNGNPVFSMVHTVSHHMKFNSIPPEESLLYKGYLPRNKQEEFLNSLHTTDRYLGQLIDEMKKRNLYENSIIIITGDHSYPAGEHFLYDNQVSYYQEFFKTPFVIIWPGKITPENLKEKTYSHIDVLPTVMDLIGHKGDVESMGVSMLDKKGSTALLVQPYNGTYLGAVKWPWKYIWERRSNRDFIFNINEDPMEKVKLKNQEILDELKPNLDKIIYSFEKFYNK